MAIKKSDLYSSLWASCNELRGGMDASQYKDSAEANPTFVFYLFQTVKYRDYINNLRPSSIESLEFSTPPVPEQTAIAAVLSDVDAELSALEARREKTRDLKQAMMQELLTGMTRLVTDVSTR